MAIYGFNYFQAHSGCSSGCFLGYSAEASVLLIDFADVANDTGQTWIKKLPLINYVYSSGPFYDYT